ncbi:hypothetical protein [Absidia glauca]|uniref:K Homology domain-containing protein n=1 Tax=Absidia glauca TaxID=4829 RepID=A0A168T149_ABSGL|nr:hypothetical protein [Absidia glauca]
MHFSACSVSLLAVDEHCQLNEAQLDQVKSNLILHPHPELKLSHVAPFALMTDEQRQTHSFYLNAVMMGPANVAMLARGDLLRQTPLKSKCMIHSFHPDLLSKQSELHDTLNDIATEQGSTIQVLCQSKPKMIIYGSMDAIMTTRIQILVLLDEQLGLSTDTIDVPCYMQHLIAGKRQQQLQTIMEETGTNIYLQSPFLKLSDLQHMELPVDQRDGVIHLTGTPNGIQRAKDLIRKLTVQKKKSMYHKESIMKPTKLDWILRYQPDQLTKIMKDNGSVILFPALGSGCNTVTVYGENRVSVERSLRLLNYLQYDLYEVSFIFKSDDNADEETTAQHIFGSLEKLSLILSQLTQISGTEMIYCGHTQRLTVIGSSEAIFKVCSTIRNMPFFKIHQPAVHFAIEMASDQREFISGKKNGKINKIMKTCNVQLQFTTTNEYNVAISVESTDISKSLVGLEMLKEELPAETSFYVPELYHRRIIGVGGKNIQRVMKKFGVYVKFSGAEEFAAMGGYFENDHNVVARTPMKNKDNLYQLQQAVMEFIGSDKDKDFAVRVLSLPLHLHGQFMHQGQQQGIRSHLEELERIYHTRIEWPDRIGSDKVVVYGPLAQLPRLIDFVRSKVPQDLVFAVTFLNATDGQGGAGEGLCSKLLKWQQSLEQQLKTALPTIDVSLQYVHRDPTAMQQQLNPTATRVQWKHTFYRPDATEFCVRYNTSLKSASSSPPSPASSPVIYLDEIKSVILQQCQMDGFPVEFEPEVNEMSTCSLNGPPTAVNSVLLIDDDQNPSLSSGGVLPPSPSISPQNSSQNLSGGVPLFDPTKSMYDTEWSMFTPPHKSASPPPPFKTSYADHHRQQYHPGPPHTYRHPMYYQQQQQGFYSSDQQPVRSVLESTPPPSSKSMTLHPYHLPHPRLPPYHHPLDQLPPLFMGKRFSVPMTQQQQQEQQQKFLHHPHSTTFDNRKSLHTANSWATPGNPVSQTRSSCPNIFLAPDLFASTSLRRASIPVTGPPSHL